MLRGDGHFLIGIMYRHGAYMADNEVEKDMVDAGA